jgi:hypothetical protein
MLVERHKTDIGGFFSLKIFCKIFLRILQNFMYLYTETCFENGVLKESGFEVSFWVNVKCWWLDGAL